MEMASIAMASLNSRIGLVLPGEYFEPRWYAAYTCARHEKRVAEQLERRSVELFLPLYDTVHRWKNGRAGAVAAIPCLRVHARRPARPFARFGDSQRGEAGTRWKPCAMA